MLSERQQRTPKGFGHIVARTAEGGLFGTGSAVGGVTLSVLTPFGTVSPELIGPYVAPIALIGAILGLAGGTAVGIVEVKRKKLII